MPLLFFIFASSLGQSYEESLLRIQSRYQTLQNYQCTFISYACNVEKSEEITYRYFFKKPGSVRMEVRTGSYEGAVLLYAGSNVRVKIGHGILSWFSFSFDPANKIVCDLRGNGLHQSDWGWYIEQHVHMMPLTLSRFIGIDTIEGKRSLKYELVSKDPGQTRSIVTEQLWIDAQQDILLQYKQYDNTGKLIQSGLYQDIVFDVGMNDNLFTEFSR